MSLHIRDEVPADAAPIARVVEHAFRHADHSGHTEQFIVAALRAAGQMTVSLVAEDRGDVIGHIAMSPVRISPAAAGWYGLGLLAVTPRRQREGIGRELVERALLRLRELGARGCVVLGDPDYYRRFGFRSEPSLRLSGVSPIYFQALAFDGAVPSGDVSYHVAFAAQA